jgi:hypothetical protein
MTNPIFPSGPAPDLLELIPEPDIVRSWLAEAVRRSQLLRSLLRVAVRKAAFSVHAEPSPKGDADRGE